MEGWENKAINVVFITVICAVDKQSHDRSNQSCVFVQQFRLFLQFVVFSRAGLQPRVVHSCFLVKTRLTLTRRAHVYNVLLTRAIVVSWMLKAGHSDPLCGSLLQKDRKKKNVRVLVSPDRLPYSRKAAAPG